MADLTPEERAGLRDDIINALGCSCAECVSDPGNWTAWAEDADSVLDAIGDRLAELVRERDEAVALLRRSPPISRNATRPVHARSLCDCDACAFLAGLDREVPDDH